LVSFGVLAFHENTVHIFSYILRSVAVRNNAQWLRNLG
jgi:hypothetical protein